MKVLCKVIFFACACQIMLMTAFAETVEQKGERIAREIREINEGFIGEKSVMEMILIDAHGSSVRRELKGKVQEVKGDGDRSLSIFITPRDVKVLDESR